MPQIHYTRFAVCNGLHDGEAVKYCYGLGTDLTFMLWTCCRLATGKLVKWILAYRQDGGS